MSQNESVQFFFRFIKEKHEVVKTQFNNLMQAISSDIHSDKIAANNTLLEANQDLSRALAIEDRPSWLEALIVASSRYKERQGVTGENYKLLNQLVMQRDALLSHKWSFDKPSSENNFDFDAIYERYRKESKLQELFDCLIDVLQKMMASGEIDSISSMRSIEQLISLIKQNRAGSYFSTIASWEFIVSFTKNLAWQEFGNLPVVKQLKTAFEKTVKEMDIELAQLHKKMSDEMKLKFHTTVRAITYKSINPTLENTQKDKESN